MNQRQRISWSRTQIDPSFLSHVGSIDSLAHVTGVDDSQSVYCAEK